MVVVLDIQGAKGRGYIYTFGCRPRSFQMPALELCSVWQIMPPN